MEEEEPSSLACPFCGAPYRGIVGSGTVQLKCQYCGGTFVLPAIQGVEAPRCENHPEKFAMGMCNDCHRSFCGDCLYFYDLAAHGSRVSGTLFLCRDCISARGRQSVTAYFVGGAILFLMGIAFFFEFPFIGVFVLVFSLGVFAIGFGQRQSSLGTEPTLGMLNTSYDKKKKETNTAVVYHKLLSYYTSRWGAGMGYDLLREEIAAHMRKGDEYDEAVQRIYLATVEVR